MAVLKAAYTALILYLMRRRQFDNVKLRTYFRKHYGIDVGLYSYGCFDRWRMPGPLRVGRYCSIAGTVRSTNNNHPITALTTHPVLYERKFGGIEVDHEWQGRLTIGDDVWIGHNVVILPGCQNIGRGAIVGAGSIVTRNVEPYTIVAGNPARKLRDRFPPDLIATIEASRWWELDIPALRALIQQDRALVYHPTAESLAAWMAAAQAQGNGEPTAPGTVRRESDRSLP
ncbi:CatB-related O-acetyltransferase [Lichenifustis flavocetrariae]|nr:CatB-related O-acetyltransferase [Lichenifustis flavocetrariae]